jgi:nucleotide-binding universal stress UspA family protein
MTTRRQRHRGRARRVDLLHARAVRSEQTEELLVVIEATGNERGVLSVAELLARRDRINAHLVGVDEPSDATGLTPQESADIHAGRQRRLLNRTRQLLHRAVGRGAYWSTDAALGRLVTVLSDEARKGNPRLVLMALPEPGAKRLRAADALVAIVNAVDVPILAVPRRQELLPNRILVATDFSRASTRAARAAVSVLGPRGNLTLLHVHAARKPGSGPSSAEGVARRFEELRCELDEEARTSIALRRRTSIVKDAVLLRGDEPAPAILEFAATHRHDLIAVGTRRLPTGKSAPLGSVSTAVLRGAQCAVLVGQPAVRRRVAGPTDPFFKAHHTAT